MPEFVLRLDAVEADPWTIVGLEANDPAAALPAGPVVVPLAQWREQKDALLARHERVGVWLAPDDDAAALAGDYERLSLVAIRFPKFTDGRGYSTAILVRRAGFKGELRAFGDVGLDQLTYLRRCGFDAFKLKPGLDPAAALRHLHDFRDPYQGALDDPRPLFRRRAVQESRP